MLGPSVLSLKKSLRPLEEEVEDMVGDLEGGEMKLLGVFAVEDQVPSYIKRPGSTIVTLVKKISSHASVLETGTRFWTKGAT